VARLPFPGIVADRGQDLFYRALHIRIEMDRINHHHIAKRLHHVPQGPANVFKAGPEIFPAMAGDQNQPFAIQAQAIFLVEKPLPVFFFCFNPTGNNLQGIDHRIAGDPDALGQYAFGQQVVPGPGSGGKVVVSQNPGQLPVDFFREGAMLVPGAEARFHVAHGDFQVEGRQGRHKGGGGIAVDQHQVRLFPAQNLF
jgi:hypothetical protein